MSRKTRPLTYVKYLWNDADARALDGRRSARLSLEQARRRPHADQHRRRQHVVEADRRRIRSPATTVEVLWVKGSGGDLRTAKRDGFASLYLDKVRAMKPRYLSSAGARAEDADRRRDVPDVQPLRLQPEPARVLDRHAAAHLRARTSTSITCIPNAVIAVAASVNQERLCREIYGDDVIYVPWQRPGFDIGLMIERLIAENPQAKGVLLGHHGMSSWSNDDKTCYETALEIIDRAAQYIEAHDKGDETFGGQKHAPLADASGGAMLAEILPWLRGQISAAQRFVGTVQDDERMLRFVNSVDAPRLAALGHVVPRPLPAHQDQAALRRLGPGDRRRRRR